MLRERRWAGFTLLAVAFVLLFVRLSFWQWSRLHDTKAANAVTRAHLAEKPVPYADLVALLPTHHDIDHELEWRAVSVTGRWDGEHQVLIRNRASQDGAAGYEVVTPLVPASGPVLLVDRGWVPAGKTPEAPDTPPVPQPGIVSVTARLQPTEPDRPADGLPQGQLLSIATDAVARDVPYPLVPGYAVLVDEQPAPPAGAAGSVPQPLPGPVLDDGPGEGHLSYAVQWLLFAGVAVGGWWVFLRREKDERDAAAAAPVDDWPEVPSNP
jgi:cytochrome oxidase assembly protein ShyY1